VNKTFISLLLALLLTACASGVKLNEVPVVDKKASSVSNGASSSGLSDINPSASSSSQQVQQPKSTVEPVNSLANENAPAGPANIEKIVYFDYDKSGLIEFDEFIRAIRGPMNANRKKIVA
jgi:peptidoglycan-associated lipoprotein